MKYLYTPEATNFVIFAVVGNPWFLLVCYLLIVNLIAFILMGVDKSKSKKAGKRRIPEKTLFLSAILGGSIGAILGMRTFRHKTKHWYFVWGMPFILVLQIALPILIAVLLR